MPYVIIPNASVPVEHGESIPDAGAVATIAARTGRDPALVSSLLRKLRTGRGRDRVYIAAQGTTRRGIVVVRLPFTRKES